MAKIWIDHSDGRYSTRQLTDEEAARRVDDVVYLEDTVWESYLRHCDRDSVWQTLWRSIDNEQAMRRREKELMPLEDAEREIRKLTADLKQAKRMWSFFEGEYTKHRQEKHREEYDDLTCVYPQPDCRIEVLPPEWREDAQEILEHFNVERLEGGLKYQGCCCGHTHRLLDEATAQQLRNCGFIVENDTKTQTRNP